MPRFAWILALLLFFAWTPAHAAPTITKAPELVRFVEAEYPPEAHAAGETAVVGLGIELDASGRVTAVSVVKSASPAFDDAAVRAAKQFEFTPAEIDGKPAAISIEYDYAFTIEAPPPIESAALGGVVVARDAKTPLAGVRVELRVAGEPVRVATTSADGRFRFDDVPPGDHEIALSGASIDAVTTRETLAAGEDLAVSYEVAVAAKTASPRDTDDIEILVVAPKAVREPTATRVVADDARQVPGSSGDVLRVVESMPGVARATAGSGQLLVWGTAPQDTRVYVDGVPIPRLYHEGGLRTVVQPGLVQTIDLVPGGQGAMWGRSLGGLVAVTTATPERDRVGGSMRADLLDASALASAPLDRRGRWHFAAGVRASYVDAWAERFIDRGTAGLVPVPKYGDGQARVLWRPSSRDSLEIVAMASSDRVRRGVPDPDPALAISDTRSTDFGRIYARWTRTARENVTLVVTPYVGLERGTRRTAVGPAATSVAMDDVLAGVRVNSAWRPRRWLQFDVGLDAEIDTATLQRVGSLGLPAREGDIRAFGQPPPEDLSADAWRVTRIGIAPYVQAELAPWRGKLSIIPGVRLDPYARAIDRRTPPQAATPKVGVAEIDFAVEPRLAIVGRPIERLELRAATGLYRQSPAPEDLSAAFGTPSLPAAKALHTIAGIKVGIVRTLSLDVTGFFIRSRELAMRTDAASPLPAQALAPTGIGRSYGMQVLLRQELWRGLFGWVAYTLMRSERRDREGAAFRRSDYDQTHILTALLAWALPRGFEVGARLRFTSGFPRTPVVGAWFDPADNRWQPRFGAHNSIRLPAFVQLDARVAKRFDIRRTVLSLFVEVLNVWNRANAEEFAYAADYSRRGTITGYPILPALGVQWDF